MKKICFSLLLLIAVTAQAQRCSDSFIAEVLKQFEREDRRFNRIASNVLKEHAIDVENAQMIHIPVMFVTREGQRLYRSQKADREDLICYLNRRKIHFEQSIILSDTTIIGTVGHPFASIPSLKFTENVFWRPLWFKIRELNPDFIFRIFNFPRGNYWYIKNNHLYVLKYERTKYGPKNFMVINAKDYLRYHVEEASLVFLLHRPLPDGPVSGGGRNRTR